MLAGKTQRGRCERSVLFRWLFRSRGVTRLRVNIHGEFDPGSGRTLAACLTHASRTMSPGAESFDLHVLSTPPAFVLSQDQTLHECLPVIGTHTLRAGQPCRNMTGDTASSLCLLTSHAKARHHFFKGTSSTEVDGVSTYLALIFGTLLSSQGTDASFVLTLSGFPPGVSLRSCVSDSIRLFHVRLPRCFPGSSLSCFPFRRFRLYQGISLSLTTRRLPKACKSRSRSVSEEEESRPSGFV